MEGSELGEWGVSPHSRTPHSPLFRGVGEVFEGGGRGVGQD